MFVFVEAVITGAISCPPLFLFPCRQVRNSAHELAWPHLDATRTGGFHQQLERDSTGTLVDHPGSSARRYFTRGCRPGTIAGRGSPMRQGAFFSILKARYMVYAIWCRFLPQVQQQNRQSTTCTRTALQVKCDLLMVLLSKRALLGVFNRRFGNLFRSLSLL